MLSFFQNYQQNIAPKLQKEFGIKNKMAAPKVLKVVVNMGTGDIKDNSQERQKVANELASITGQKPQARQAKKSIAGFNLREGEAVGFKITLRGKRMYDFLQKLFYIVLPRIRDFRGLPKAAFDKNGNYTIAIRENTVFPEIDLGKVTKVRGLEITIVTSTANREQAEKLLSELGLPFEKS